MYQLTTHIATSVTLPKPTISRMTVGNPSADWYTAQSYSVFNPMSDDRMKKTTASMDTIFNGRDENDRMALSAYFSSPHVPHWLVPAARSATLNGMVVVRKPSQSISPRKKSSRS